MADPKDSSELITRETAAPVVLGAVAFGKPKPTTPLIPHVSQCPG